MAKTHFFELLRLCVAQSANMQKQSKLLPPLRQFESF